MYSMVVGARKYITRLQQADVAKADVPEANGLTLDVGSYPQLPNKTCFLLTLHF